ncbi:LuxR C-terminal-related transcriptional regulator [Fusibacter sp. 3D3]|uniref:helix-turn-helix transcriptional regulator n=1 Tax=Fusibacter sp. 3D3 TaxID=1048380 RepID=UPI0008536ED1|nr:LuxR C-terminal-related transcriptional regulator [Fusibacter sp. 3D3]GAU78460.1 regulatory protein related to malT [Fusibacter sp. 3D3]
MYSRSNTRSLYFSDRIKKTMESILEYPFAIIEAPMGYGKTTTLRATLSRPEITLLWQKIHDDSTTNFWSDFSNLFNPLDPELAQNLDMLGLPTDSLLLNQAVNFFVKSTFKSKTVIVFDDYHLLENRTINRFIEYLVTNEIENLFIVLSARFSEFERLEEFELKGYLKHICKETFEFRPEDIMAYYKLCGQSIKSEDAHRLHTYTEGWISALYLLMLNFDADDQYLDSTNIYSLIEKIIYLPLRARYKAFLLTLCIFERFTLNQAQLLCDDAHVDTLIQELVLKNAFITYDADEKYYYMHSILKSFLETQLEHKGPHYKQSLYIRAAQWSIDNAQYLTAMYFSNLAEDYTTLMKSIELDRGHSFNSDHKELMINYIEHCPLEIKNQFPLAILIYLRRLFTYNKMDLFKKNVGELVANIQTMSESDQVYKNRILGEYELIMSFTGYNDIEKMSAFHQRACTLLTEPSVILDNKASWTFGSPSVLYMFHRKTGELKREVDVIKIAMPYYYKPTRGHGMGAEYMMAAERYYLLGDFENAEILTHQALQTATNSLQHGIMLCAVFLQIKLSLIKGDFLAVQILLKKVRDEINKQKLYLFMHTLDMCEAQIFASLNIKKRVPLWISRGELTSTRLFFPTLPYLNMIYSRVLIINGEYLKLLGNAEHFLNIASVFPNILAQIYTHIYIAVANKQISRHGESLDALKKALELAIPDQILMPFVENSDFIKPILEELRTQSIYVYEIENILELYKVYQKSLKGIIKEHFTENAPQLSERETEIALLASKGFSNKEIGAKLFISPNTVKSQLKSVFEKLNVNSRALLNQYFEA